MKKRPFCAPAIKDEAAECRFRNEFPEPGINIKIKKTPRRQSGRAVIAAFFACRPVLAYTGAS